ncbi:MAG: hypothetical protein KDB14_17980 [Planctomycetales bacterium]|nr:hypothetical protein [Planctomycetales bacterium]
MQARSFLTLFMLQAIAAGVVGNLSAQTPPAPKPPAPAPEPEKTSTGIEIGKQTTWIEGPLRNGEVDYLAALNESLAKGVTVENNAAVPFWLAMGPGQVESMEVDVAAFYRALGAPQPPADGPYWQLRTGAGAERDPYDDWELKPWARDEHPQLAKWLDDIQAPLDEVVRGLNRTHWHVPLLPSIDGAPELLIGMKLPSVSMPRDVSRALVARAMLRAKQEDYEGAWRDIRACHRLGRHVGKGAFMIDMLVGIAIDGQACMADVQLSQLPLPASLRATILRDLAGLPDLPRTVDVLNRGERMMFLDAVTGLAAGRKSDDLFGENAVVQRILSSTLDWNETLKVGNEYYDKIVVAMSRPTHRERLEANVELEKAMKELAVSARPTPLGVAAILLSGSAPKRLGQQIGKILVSVLLPASGAARDAEQRARQGVELATLAYRLDEHRQLHGSYPARLSDLRGAVANDLFSDEPLKYERTAQGFLLYSVGRNLRDDEGAGPWTGANSIEQDDIAVKR